MPGQIPGGLSNGLKYILGANAEGNPSSYTIESPSLALLPATREGYTFLGWSDGSTIVSTIEHGSYGDLTLTALWKAVSYSVSYELDGGANSLGNPESYTIESPNITLGDASKPGYTFLGWYKEPSFKTQVSAISAGSCGDLTLYAKFSIVSYSITYDLDGGTQSGNPSEVNVESEAFTLNAPTKKGYEFLGWTGSNGETPETNAVIPSGTLSPLSYKANWSAIKYSITYDLAGGILSSANPSAYTVEDSVTLASPTKKGYSFGGWYKGSTYVGSISRGTVGDMTLTAKWNLCSYSISYNLNGGTNDLSNPVSYTIESNNINLVAPTRNGYTFKGWYSDSSFETEVKGIPSGSTGEASLYAKWEANKNSLSVISNDESKGTVYFAGEGYTDEKIIAQAIPVGDWVFKGWYCNGVFVSSKNPYSLSMPSNDLALEARFMTKAEAKRHGILPVVDKANGTLTYGLYPQKRVSDEATLKSLNALTSAESNGWYLLDGEYYAKKEAYSWSSSYVFDDGAKIVSGTTYWFKCDPIEWKILSSESGEYSLVSTLLLDAHRYNAYWNGEDSNGYYANNYERSEIREWLNGDFYDSAFSLGGSCVLTTAVDNSASTTGFSGNPYACGNTEDKVYLLSYQDYKNSDYFANNAARQCKTTDWARASGAYCDTSSSYLYNGFYWTRSPRSYYSDLAWGVRDDGALYNFGDVYHSNCSVRPSLRIKAAE